MRIPSVWPYAMKPFIKYTVFPLISLFLLGAGTARADSVLDLPYQNMEMKTIKQEGTLVFSDSPEYANAHGILAEGTINGKGRIYYYHVNDTGDLARLVVYAENRNKKPADMEVTKFLQGEPSLDYVTSGATLSYNEMISLRQKHVPVTLAPGERRIIAEENADGLSPDYLYTGLVEVNTKKTPVHFGTAFLPMSDDETLAEALKEAQPVAVDEHEMRGTYPMAIYKENKKVWDTDKDGPVALVYGSSESHDFVTGLDELDHVARENTGNYGITVYMTVKTKGTKPFHIYFNPQGGVYLGSFKISQGYSPRYFRTDDMKYWGRWIGDGTDQDYIDAGTWKPGKPITIEFMAAGATYLPVRFLFVPET